MWQDWSTDSGFRIRISGRARELLAGFPPGLQVRLRTRLHELAELAELMPLGPCEPSKARPTLQFSVEGVVVRYSIAEAQRALEVEAVLARSNDGDGFGRTA